MMRVAVLAGGVETIRHTVTPPAQKLYIATRHQKPGESDSEQDAL